MAGTIIARTNLAGLYYNLVRKASGGNDRVELAFHVPLLKGETAIPVNLSGEFQFTFGDWDNYYGGGSFGKGITVTDGETVVVERVFYDADGNDLQPSRPVTAPVVPEAPVEPEVPVPPVEPTTPVDPVEPEAPVEPEVPTTPVPKGVFEQILALVTLIFKTVFGTK